MPKTFEEISVKRCLIDVFLVLGGYVACSFLGMEVALDNTRNIRRNLILQSKE